MAIDNPEFRRGIIFLQQGDVRVLGGQVSADWLMLSSSRAAMLHALKPKRLTLQVQNLQEARRRVQAILEEEPSETLLQTLHILLR